MINITALEQNPYNELNRIKNYISLALPVNASI